MYHLFVLALCVVHVSLIATAANAENLPYKITDKSEIKGKYTSIFQLKDQEGKCFLAESSLELSLQKICLFNHDLQIKNKTGISSNILSALNFKDHIYVVYGSGRINRAAALRLVKYDSELKNEKEILQINGERNEGSIKSDGKDLLLTYFESKYNTKTGKIDSTKTGLDSFSEMFSLRMGALTDLHDDKIFVGRPYGDSLGQDGDLQVWDNNQLTVLPSYRGLRGLNILTLNGEKQPAIVIGDGWHQDYGKFAQARISVIREERGKYNLELVDIEKSQHSFTQFSSAALDKQQAILALGSDAVFLYKPASNWQKTRIYEQKDQDSLLGLANLGASNDGVHLAVLDGEIKHLIISK